MHPNAPWHKACLAAGLLGAAICPVHSHAAAPQETHAKQTSAHHTHAAEPADEGHHRLYYRPFCRRSHYATSPSAPCWE